MAGPSDKVLELINQLTMHKHGKDELFPPPFIHFDIAEESNR